MLNFTVGPVQSSECVKEIGALDVPYFRTQEFSNIMLENEKLMKKFAYTSEDSSVVFMTGSGTASMDAIINNLFTQEDKLLIINGGSFGHRFCEICDVYEIPYTDIKLNFGEQISKEKLNEYDGKGYTAFLVNLDETSTGILYDINVISEFCNKNNLFLVVDAISAFFADEIKMTKSHINTLITGSQKALACPPGISIIVLDRESKKRVYANKTKCYYLDLKKALENQKRGQTPFTPAVGTLIQINARLKEIDANGGVEIEMNKIQSLALDFRSRIKDLPFEFATKDMPNGVTALKPLTASAYDIFLILKDEYNIWICPNGGELKDKIFRVGHLGNLTIDDNTTLINAFKDLKKRKII